MLRWLTIGIDVLGRFTAWVSLAMVVAMCVIVVLRYGFSLSYVALQEAVMYLHAALFMLGAAYTLQQDGHVRIDIFQRNFSPQMRAGVELFGIICLLWPFCAYLGYSSWGYVWDAWALREGSAEPGGLPAVFMLKTLLLLMPALLALQGLVQAVAAVQIIRGSKVASC